MGLTDSARVFTQAAVWRTTRSRKAGRSLISAACSDDEETAALAGILLTRAGDRVVPLIAEAISEGADDPMLLDLLTSVGSPSARAELRQIADSGAARLREAAQESLATLEQMDALSDEA